MLFALALASVAPSASEQAAALFWQACGDGKLSKAAAMSKIAPDKLANDIKRGYSKSAAIKAWELGKGERRSVLVLANYAPPEQGVVMRCAVFSRSAELQELADRVDALSSSVPYAPHSRARGVIYSAVLSIPDKANGWIMNFAQFADGAVAEVTHFDTAAPEYETSFKRFAARADLKWRNAR